MNEAGEKHDRIAYETRTEVEKTDRRNKIALLVVSCLTIVLLAWAALSENVLARWRSYRQDYKALLHEKATDDFGLRLAGSFQLGLEQNVLPAAIDRCATCHTGIDDPRMAEAPQPFRTHPGSYLQIHEPAKFGCTVCHEGQGRATTVEDAHGAEFWDYPLLDRPFIKSSCAKCHDHTQLYGTARLIDAADEVSLSSASTRNLDAGWRLMRDRGCLGCHMLNGQGGELGPDLTYVGDKTHHEFSFAHLEHGSERQVSVWHREHFRDPKKVSPGSQMPDTDLTEEEADALTSVMLSFRKSVGTAAWHFADSAHELRSGAELYATYCSSCHGREGMGTAIPDILTPSLNNDDVLGVADDEYLRRIIRSGRSGTLMPGWGPGRGNLSTAEIERLVEHIRSWQNDAGEPHEVLAANGDANFGRAYYMGLCANCHGTEGEGGIGLSLSSPSFQSIASDRFLAETIANGRPGTAMPSWKRLPTQALADVVAFIRGWQPQGTTFTAVQKETSSQSRSRLRQDGKQLFGLHCATCHGDNGEGGIGVSLRTPGLLRVVDDAFLFQTILEGRPGTGMPAWRHLSAPDIAAILAYVRSWQTGKRLVLAANLPKGDHIAGETHYEVSCQRCHGVKGSGGVGPNLTNEVLLKSAGDAQLFEWIAHGRPGTAMKGFLPEEQGPTRLQPEQIRDVISYLRYVGRDGNIPLRRIGEGNPTVGAAQFAGTCASCHGANGEGTSGPQLNNPSFLRAASDGFLSATIVLGREGTPMRSMVHGQQGLGQIDADQVQDLIAFMRLWEAPGRARTPARFVDLTEHAIANGKQLFSSYCIGCHGDNGRGIQDGPGHYAPALNNQDFLAAASDGFLLATIARGRLGTPMRPFGEGSGGIVSLRPQEIRDLVSYIRSWQKGVSRLERHVASGGRDQ